MATYDLWIAAGQSHMVGLGTASEAPVPDPALGLEWDNPVDGLVPLQDPGVDGSDYQAQTGCMGPMFVIQITKSTGRPSVWVRTSIGGTALLASNAGGNGDWSPTGSLFGDAVTRASDAMTAITTAGHTVGEVHVMWCQGGRDARIGNDLHLYQAAYEDLANRFQTALSIPSLQVYCVRSGTTCGIAGPEPATLQVVRDAQDAACAAQADMHMVYTDATSFCDWGWQKFDGVHWKQIAHNTIGAAMAEYVADDLGFSPPSPPEFPTPDTSVTARRLMRLCEPSFTYASPGVHTFTALFDAPSGIMFEAIGGGQAGDNFSLSPKPGGDGASYAAVTTGAVTAGDQFTITVASGGTSDLDPGGDSSVDAICVAPGGGSGTSAVGDTTTAGEAGGAPGGGLGGDGGDAASGGSLTGGLGGAGGDGGPPAPGGFPGGGGGGADSGSPNNVGGAGGSGVVQVTYL